MVPVTRSAKLTVAPTRTINGLLLDTIDGSMSSHCRDGYSSFPRGQEAY
jgi:hypothetical protein